MVGTGAGVEDGADVEPVVGGRLGDLQDVTVAVEGGAWRPGQVFEREVGVIEPALGAVLPAQVVAGDLVAVDRGTLGGVVAAHADPLVLVAQLGGPLHQVAVIGGPGQLAEDHVLGERGRRRPELGEDARWQVGRVVAPGRAQLNRFRRAVVLGLVGDEVAEPVAQDRPGDRQPVLLLPRTHLHSGPRLGRGRRAPAGVGTVPEEAALEIVAARPGGGHHRGTANLVELGLVVGGDDLVLADGRLRERIATGRILAADAAGQGVALLPHAVDIDVDRAGILRARTQPGVATGVLLELHARHQVGEGQEIARALRQGLDLARRDIGGELGRPRLHRHADHLHRVQRGRIASRCGRGIPAQAQVQGGGLSDLDGQLAHRRLATGLDLDAVSARRQAGDRVVPVSAGLHAAAQAGGRVEHDHRGIGHGLSTDGRAGALRQRRHCGQRQATAQRRGQQRARRRAPVRVVDRLPGAMDGAGHG